MVAFDASFLTLLLHPYAKPPINPQTKKPVDLARERIEHLIRELDKRREKIIVPTPALSEVLTLASDRASDYLAELTAHYRFVVAAFDEVAAVEAAIATASAKRQQGSKRGQSSATWDKVKFDRQIVAIAKTQGAQTIYSNDGDVRKFAELEGMKVIAVWDLPEPPALQMDLDYEKEAKKP